MKTIKHIPFLLIIVGTFGLLAVELFIDAGSRYLTLSFAALNVLGLVMLVSALKHKKIQ